MSNSRENILLTALRLFSQNGYEAVSISDIAGALGLSKGAMYKHFKNKRDLFDQILIRMEEDDARRAQAFSLPEESKSVSPEKYASASLECVIAFAEAQFDYWTADPFAAPFRRMIVLEQYRSAEMSALYQNYLVSGPLNYTLDLLSSLNVPDPRGEALALYAPMFFLYSLSDAEPDSAKAFARAHFAAARARLIAHKEVK